MYLHSDELLSIAEETCKPYSRIADYVDYLLFTPKPAPFPIEAQIMALIEIAISKYGHRKDYLLRQCVNRVWMFLPLFEEGRGHIKGYIAHNILSILSSFMKANKQSHSTYRTAEKPEPMFETKAMRKYAEQQLKEEDLEPEPKAADGDDDPWSFVNLCKG